MPTVGSWNPVQKVDRWEQALRLIIQPCFLSVPCFLHPGHHIDPRAEVHSISHRHATVCWLASVRTVLPSLRPSR